MPKSSVATSLTSRAQPVLDSLFKDNLIPFQLTAAKVDCLGPNEYIIRFHDSRLQSVDVTWEKGQSFEDVFRTAMINRIRRMSVPFGDATGKALQHSP